MKNIKKETSFICFFAIVLIMLTMNTKAYPYYEDNCVQPGCHITDNAGVLLTQNITQFTYNKGEQIIVKIDVQGGIPGMYALFHSDQKDNGLVTISPDLKIKDNDPSDVNPNAGEMTIIFTFTFPDENINLEMDFYVIFVENNVKYSKVMTFTFQIGNGGGINLPTLDKNLHYTGYLGIPAVISLIIATLLYTYSKERFTKTHGILATTSLILTTINVIYILPQTWSYLAVLFSNPTAFDLIHVSHIVFGFLGMFAGVIAIVSGISGNRSKKPGYIALIFWSLNLIIGALQWGLAL